MSIVKGFRKITSLKFKEWSQIAIYQLDQMAKDEELFNSIQS
jgi:hypothetical protein